MGRLSLLVNQRGRTKLEGGRTMSARGPQSTSLRCQKRALAKAGPKPTVGRSTRSNWEGKEDEMTDDGGYLSSETSSGEGLFLVNTDQSP